MLCRFAAVDRGHLAAHHGPGHLAAHHGPGKHAEHQFLLLYYYNEKTEETLPVYWLFVCYRDIILLHYLLVDFLVRVISPKLLWYTTLCCHLYCILHLSSHIFESENTPKADLVYMAYSLFLKPAKEVISCVFDDY